MGLIDDILNWIDRRRRPHGYVPVTPVGPAPSPPPPGPASGVSLLLAVNAARAGRGLPALNPDYGVAAVAAGWSVRMANRFGLSHNELGAVMGAVAGSTAAGECIAAGQATADEVVADWLSDLPHRKIVLGDYNRGGCGVAARPKDGTLFWTLDVVRVG